MKPMAHVPSQPDFCILYPVLHTGKSHHAFLKFLLLKYLEMHPNPLVQWPSHGEGASSPATGVQPTALLLPEQDSQ